MVPCFENCCNNSSKNQMRQFHIINFYTFCTVKMLYEPNVDTYIDNIVKNVVLFLQFAKIQKYLVFMKFKT